MGDNVICTSSSKLSNNDDSYNCIEFSSHKSPFALNPLPRKQAPNTAHRAATWRSKVTITTDLICAFYFGFLNSQKRVSPTHYKMLWSAAFSICLPIYRAHHPLGWTAADSPKHWQVHFTSAWYSYCWSFAWNITQVAYWWHEIMSEHSKACGFCTCKQHHITGMRRQGMKDQTPS